MSEKFDLKQAFNVEGLSTLVTGAASGLGLAYAEVMADMGAKVTLTDINPDTLQQQVDRLAARGCTVRGAVLDVTNREQMAQVFKEANDAYGSIDVVFANAGIDVGPGFLTVEDERNPAGEIENVSDEAWDRSINANLTSVFNTIKAAVKYMKPKGSGRIIVTSSNAAIICEPIVGTPYMPAKAGVAHLVRQMALELAKYGIQINAIAPGAFMTNIAGGRLKNAEDRKAFEVRNPLGRIATPDEIKGLALYLASPASSYVNGAQIVIDGGTMLGQVD
ncbi:SDR family NAD(P)-dependent oxidoreductase [Emcibacter nanhaiensis]|uniref:SDR family oxidoreductase n=1 Tax=Emcibacter nanhaiensis TaxID=1505037 RepID=A0A501PBX3_9PROT|nr:SDR family NAD(P)-dependent oxidoreductase [Emcibacter nanhaiensis]TPD57374.1 SDR family oxidoreductase [Emcibacter nanhaiensis]